LAGADKLEPRRVRFRRMSPSVTVDFRRLLANASLTVAACAFAWLALLKVTGGFNATIFGLSIRSHDPSRPFLAGIIALVVFVLFRGPREVWNQAVAFGRAPRAAYRSLVIVLSLAVLLYGVGWSTGIAGGSDSYGYISQAELWLRGVPVVPQPWTAEVPWPDADWTFSPLGYRPAPGGRALVPIYAVGLPLLMAAAKMVGGYAAIFWLTPIAGALIVLVAYGIGRRLDSPMAGLIAAWLLATNATFIGEVTAPMSDVIAAAALAGSCYLLLGSSPRAPVSAGLAAGLAVLVRPNLAPTAAVLALWVGMTVPAASPRQWTRQLARVALFLMAASPGFLIPAWANWRLFGSPMMSGYGSVATIYDWSHVLPNLQTYPSLLLRSRSLLALIGFALLLIPARRLWPRVSDRSVLLGVALFVFSLVAQYIAYEPASGEGYLRFLLPCLPFAFLAVARMLLLIPRSVWATALIAVVLLAQGAAGVQRGCCADLSERKYAAAGEIVRSRTEPDSVVYAFQHSGSLRHYGGRMTLRYDVLDPEWLDRSVEWFAERGVHAYAVLDSWEVDRFRERFAGQRLVSQIDRPLVTYRGAVVTYFYDLRRSEADFRTESWVDRFNGPRYPRPAEPPVFRITPGIRP